MPRDFSKPTDHQQRVLDALRAHKGEIKIADLADAMNKGKPEIEHVSRGSVRSALLALEGKGLAGSTQKGNGPKAPYYYKAK